jgi:hypothetical protein
MSEIRKVDANLLDFDKTQFLKKFNESDKTNSRVLDRDDVTEIIKSFRNTTEAKKV